MSNRQYHAHSCTISPEGDVTDKLLGQLELDRYCPMLSAVDSSDYKKLGH